MGRDARPTGNYRPPAETNGYVRGALLARPLAACHGMPCAGPEPRKSYSSSPRTGRGHALITDASRRIALRRSSSDRRPVHAGGHLAQLPRRSGPAAHQCVLGRSDGGDPLLCAPHHDLALLQYRVHPGGADHRQSRGAPDLRHGWRWSAASCCSSTRCWRSDRACCGHDLFEVLVPMLSYSFRYADSSNAVGHTH